MKEKEIDKEIKINQQRLVLFDNWVENQHWFKRD